MADYITAANFKTRHGITVSSEDARIALHITAASREIDGICGRRFDPDSVATARYFYPDDEWTVTIDDALEITEVATDTGDAGTYTTTWATTDYLTLPVNGIGVNAQTGWPTEKIRAVGSRVFSCHTRRPSVKVTAKWGWAAVPGDVVEACYLMTHRLYYEVKVPGGMTPPSVDFGLPGQTLAPQYTANQLLEPFRRGGKRIGLVR